MVTWLGNVPSPRRYALTLTPPLFVCSQVLVTQTFHEWILHSEATKHVAQDKGGFIDYRQTLGSIPNLFKENNT